MRILVAQLNPTIGAMVQNTGKIIQVLERARAQQIDIVLFSELVLCGYPPEDFLLHPSFIAAQEAYLERVIQASKGLFVVLGTVRRNPNKREKEIFNSAAIIQDGKLLGFHDKILLPTYDVFDERRYFEPGTTTQVWEFKGKKIAVLICEDMWQHSGQVKYTEYGQDPVESLKNKHLDLVLNLSASPYHFQKRDIRLKVCQAVCETLKCPLIMCCQVGGNDQLVFDGYSMVVDGQGRLRQLAKGFEEDDLVVDLNKSLEACSFPEESLSDLYRALVLGVRDYMHKLDLKKGCLGLSGGIDSALVACIAADALGKENVLAVSMPSLYSSEGSVSDAQQLARNLGIELLSIPIETTFNALLATLEPHFIGLSPDVTEENMQARIRGLILMALSNKWGHIVLSTGNKSEMGLGYCTIYGDMVGGLSVISDVTKQLVYSLSGWVNRRQEIIPQTIIDKPPSAELRPNQKDSDSLPDYAIVDRVVQDYVEEFLSAEEIAEKCHLNVDVVKDLIHRIHVAEYKRRQGAPCIRVSKRAFLAGRRFPIVQKWQ